MNIIPYIIETPRKDKLNNVGGDNGRIFRMLPDGVPAVRKISYVLTIDSM